MENTQPNSIEAVKDLNQFLWPKLENCAHRAGPGDLEIFVGPPHPTNRYRRAEVRSPPGSVPRLSLVP